MLQNPYFVSIFLYLFVILLLGLYFSRGVSTMRSFAIADKKFGTVVLLMTFLATSLGAGSTVGDTAKIIRAGIVFPLSMSGFFVFCYYMKYYVAPKFDERFEGMLSAGDIIEYFYGINASKIASFIGFFAGALTVGAQITGIGYLLEHMIQAQYYQVVIAIGVVITVYSALGGIKSVTATDVFQAITIIVIIPIFGYLIVNKAGGISYVFAEAPARLFDIWKIDNFKKYFAYFIAAFMPFLWLYPPVIQRFLMTNHSSQIGKMYQLELFTRLFLFILLTLVAAGSLILVPNINPDSAVSYLIMNILPQHWGILLVLTMLSASMSTADSHLHSSAVLFTHNLCKSFIGKKIFGVTLKEFKFVQFSTILLGILAIFIAVKRIEIVSLIILSFALSGCVIGIPLFFGVMGMKVSSKNFYYCLAFSVVTLFICLFWLNLSLINVSSIIIFGGTLGFLAPRILFQS